MHGLEHLTAKRDACMELVKLGVIATAHFWHVKEGEVWDVCMLKNPVFDEAARIPAWTKEELDFMVGNSVDKPDLPRPDRIGRAQDPDVYVIYFPDKAKWYKKGSDASADGLKWLIERGHIDIDVLNNRYCKKYGLKIGPS